MKSWLKTMIKLEICFHWYYKFYKYEIYNTHYLELRDSKTEKHSCDTSVLGVWMLTSFTQDFNEFGSW